MAEIWDVWYPKAGATGIPFGRGRINGAAMYSVIWVIRRLKRRRSMRLCEMMRFHFAMLFARIRFARRRAAVS